MIFVIKISITFYKPFPISQKCVSRQLFGTSLFDVIEAKKFKYFLINLTIRKYFIQMQIPNDNLMKTIHYFTEFFYLNNQ